jgi:GNAT superfamily N-acetyltransferase
VDATPVPIRRARLTDVDEIADVEVAARRAARRGLYSDAYLSALEPADTVAHVMPLLRRYDGLPAVWVAQADDGIVGFASVTEWTAAPTEPSAAYLAGLYVHPGWFRRGVGSTLVDTVGHFVRTFGYRKLVTWVVEEAAGANSFYSQTDRRPLDVTKQLQQDTPRLVRMWVKDV